MIDRFLVAAILVIPILSACTAAKKPVEALHTYATQEECEQQTRKNCAIFMCDYVPAGKTFEEVCGKDFKEGWAPVDNHVD